MVLSIIRETSRFGGGVPLKRGALEEGCLGIGMPRFD